MTPLYLFFCIKRIVNYPKTLFPPFIFKTEKTYMKAARLSDNLLADRKPERRLARQIDSKTSRDPDLGPGLSCLLCPYNWLDNQVTFRQIKQEQSSRTNK